MYKQSYQPRSIQMIYKFRNIILKSYLLPTNTIVSQPAVVHILAEVMFPDRVLV